MIPPDTGDPCTTPRPRWSLRLRIDSEIIRFGCAAHQLDSAAPKIPALTSREREITADVAEGLANKHIARRPRRQGAHGGEPPAVDLAQDGRGEPREARARNRYRRGRARDSCVADLDRAQRPSASTAGAARRWRLSLPSAAAMVDIGSDVVDFDHGSGQHAIASVASNGPPVDVMARSAFHPVLDGR